jgi:GPH family glycoside/pentoside/hexuronide:cation symporter
MFKDLKERTEVNSYRQGFGMVGLMIGIALPPLIYGLYGWNIMGLLFGCIISIAFMVSLLGSRENPVYLKDKRLGIKQAMEHTFRNRSFMSFVVSNLFIQYAFTMVLAMVPFYAKYVLRIDAQAMAFMLFGAFSAAFFMMFIWRAVVNRFGAKHSYMTAIILFALSLVPFMFTSGYVGSIATCIVVGAIFAGIILISDVIISDVIDEDELNTGERREGIYFGINAFVTRFAIALEAFSIGFVFNIAHYDPRMATQPATLVAGLRSLISAFPIVALLAAFLLMMLYPLYGRKLDKMKKELTALHNKKAAKWSRR